MNISKFQQFKMPYLKNNECGKNYKMTMISLKIWFGTLVVFVVSCLSVLKNHNKFFNLPETIMVALRGSPMMTARVDPRADRTAADQKSSPVAAGKTRRAPGI